MPPRAKTPRAKATADSAFADAVPATAPTPKPSTRKASGSRTTAASATTAAEKADKPPRTRKPRAKKAKQEEETGDESGSVEPPEPVKKPAPRKRTRKTPAKPKTADAAFASVNVKQEDEEEDHRQEDEELPETQSTDATQDPQPRFELEIKLEDVPEEKNAEEAAGQQQQQQQQQQQAVASTLSPAVPSAPPAPAATPSYALPGAFAPGVDTPQAMRAVVVAAIASSALAIVTRVGVDWVAGSTPLSFPEGVPEEVLEYLPTLSSWGPAWNAYQKVTELPGVWTPLAALAIRLCKLALAWDGDFVSFPQLIALDVLAYGPLVYLLASFYYVPLWAALVSAGIDLAADIAPLAAWERLAKHETAPVVKEDVDSESSQEEETLQPLNDPASFTYSAVFAGVLYAFVFVQACRLFLPSTFVVHFLGIGTVEPARPFSLPTAQTTLYDVFVCVFLSYAAVAVSFASGVAARAYIFADQSCSSTGTTYAKTIAIRSASLAAVVGANVFLQVFLGVHGVDPSGAAAYASIWSAAPLLVGGVLGLIGA